MHPMTNAAVAQASDSSNGSAYNSAMKYDDGERNEASSSALTGPTAASTSSSYRPVNAPPRRPLSAYNFYFKNQRALILEERERDPSLKEADVSKIQSTTSARRTPGLFASMAKTIAQRWKAIAPKELEKYKRLAEDDKKRYKEEIASYNKHIIDSSIIAAEKKRQELEEETKRKLLEDIEITRNSFGLTGEQHLPFAMRNMSTFGSDRDGAASSQLARLDPELQRLLLTQQLMMNPTAMHGIAGHAPIPSLTMAAENQFQQSFQPLGPFYPQQHLQTAGDELALRQLLQNQARANAQASLLRSNPAFSSLAPVMDSSMLNQYGLSLQSGANNMHGNPAFALNPQLAQIQQGLLSGGPSIGANQLSAMLSQYPYLAANQLRNLGELNAEDVARQQQGGGHNMSSPSNRSKDRQG